MPSHSQGCEARVTLACDLSPHTGSILAAAWLWTLLQVLVEGRVRVLIPQDHSG